MQESSTDNHRVARSWADTAGCCSDMGGHASYSMPGSCTAGSCCIIWPLELLNQRIDAGQTMVGPVSEDHFPACLCETVQRLHSHTFAQWSGMPYWEAVGVAQFWVRPEKSCEGRGLGHLASVVKTACWRTSENVNDADCSPCTLQVPTRLCLTTA